MSKKYNFMNILRALSMVAIVFYHMVFTLYLYGIRQLNSISMLFENTNMHIAKIGVGLFFMLSGCGLMLGSQKNDFNAKAFYLKRFKKILIPFYVVTVFYFVFLILTKQISLSNPFGDKNVNPFCFIFTLLGMDSYIDSFGIPTYSLGIGEWFLGCLIIIYLIYPLIRFLMLKNKYLFMISATIYYVVMINIYPMIPIVNQVPMYTNLVIKIYDFILGMFFALIIEKIPNYFKYAGLLITLAFILIPFKLPGINSFLIPIQCVSVFLLFSGFENTFAKLPGTMKAVSYISSISYEYFLIHHAVILFLTKQGINKAFSNIDVLMLFLEEILVTLLLSIILKKFLAFLSGL